MGCSAAVLWPRPARHNRSGRQESRHALQFARLSLLLPSSGPAVGSDLPDSLFSRLFDGIGRRGEPWEQFLSTWCIHCHGPAKVEGDLRLDTLSRDFRSGEDTHHWAETLDKVNSGEMPPRDQPQPGLGEIQSFVTALDTLLQDGRSARMAARPAVTHYRLSRRKYQNTVYDLPGVRCDPSRPGNWPLLLVPRERYLDDAGNQDERFPSPAIFPKY